MKTLNFQNWLPLSVMVLLAASGQALFAHTGHTETSGLMSGLSHPVSGLDHIVAMLAVGLWSMQFHGKLRWALPLAFPVFMAIGGLMGMSAIPLPLVEIGIALSGIILGLAVLTRWQPSIWTSLGLVAIFAVFHGYAHGAEMPVSGGALAYGLGFVGTTILLHLAGMGAGFLSSWKPVGAYAVRTCGAAIMIVGGYFLFGALAG